MLLKVVTIDHAYRAISWTTVILVAGHDPAVHGHAVDRSGARTWPTAWWTSSGDAGPYALLVGLFVLIAVLGQLISNTATALIVIPIAISSAAELDVSARPVLMA